MSLTSKLFPTTYKKLSNFGMCYILDNSKGGDQVKQISANALLIFSVIQYIRNGGTNVFSFWSVSLFVNLANVLRVFNLGAK